VSPAQRFGENVRSKREALDMTQEDLAHAAGMHPTAISHIELGKRDARFNNIVRLAAALKTPPGQLFDGISS
jgi:transcriptional regulator with XRE-family HTH domain